MSGAHVVGIDLGTTNSLVAIFTDEGPQLVPNALGHFMTPSAVGYSDDGELLIGQAAKDRLVTHPELTAARFKRYMGSNHEVSLGKRTFRAEELSSFVLRSLKQDAEARLGHPVTEAVISVPAYFNNTQRQATATAAKLAGLTVNRLVNEPTAAALAYGLQDRDGESTFLVIDLGGGTFDVSILEMFSGVMEVRASSGDAFLGGEDFTDALAAHLKVQLGIAQDAPLDREDTARLRALADRMKVQLSERANVQATFALRGTPAALEITRDSYDEIISPIIARMRLPIQRVITDAGLKADRLSRIIMVGGATRTPAVHGLVTRLFKRFPEHSIDPDHVVALGAAVQAGLAMRHAALDDVVMTDVAPFTLGYEVSMEIAKDQFEHGRFMPVIERNTVVPVSRSQVAHPVQLGQHEIKLKIFQGESPFTAENVGIGILHVPIPYNHKQYEGIEVRYTYDTSGLLEVLATVLSTKVTHRIVIESASGSMTPKEIETRLKALEKLKIHPRDKQENIALKSRLAGAYANALGEGRDYINALLEHLERALHTQDERHIMAVRTEITQRLDEMGATDVF